MAERPTRPQLRLALPVRPIEEPTPDEAPFFRPKNRTRARRPRRSLLSRLRLALQLAAVGTIAATAAWTGYAKALASEALRVDRVEVSGERFLSAGEVRELLGPAVGENILLLDLPRLKSRLRASPWVADATVKRSLPDTLQVEIHERQPLALAEVERLYLMDGDGALIDIYGPRTASFDLPIVRGLGGVDGEARRERAQRAGTLLRDLGEQAAEISEVQFDAEGELRVVLRGRGEVLRLGVPPFRKRFTTFLALRRDLAERCPDAEYFDLRFRDRIYAKEPEAPRPAVSGPEPGQADRATASPRPQPSVQIVPVSQPSGGTAGR
jgi:cell division septal protein FtsQ